ncbi:MAG TPA: hypothetical protein PLT09_10260 [Deltaproteobacteria bacterium]|nr:hypothetical protein [Deltaproteobacteria bacterium]HPR55965.1 hypothetical protein [Deltaproteobacteria bacterium]HXK47817.1 hypothetical protein [Deltaproteobacteria bacterium]
MTIIPEKEKVKQAIRWMSENLERKPNQSVQKLINKAVFEFDLSPVDAEFITRFFHERDAARRQHSSL